MIRVISLKNLRRSDRNVRITKIETDIESLAADILARGLLQNLVVIPARGDRAKYDVIGGGRRLAALNLLASQGHIDGEFPVPCVVRDAAEAEECSLAENVQRVEMHPADAFQAFAALVAQGKSVEDIAKRFGLPQRVVNQRLKLGRLSPRLLEEYRNGKITLEHCEAFTLTDDHGMQESVYDALSRSYSLYPHHIRQHLTTERVPVSSKLGMFVLDAYTKAGHPLTTDLFAEDGRYLDDRQTVISIAGGRLQAECERLVQDEGWAWATPLLEYDYAAIAATRRVVPDTVPELTDEQEARRLALVIEHNTILSQYRPDLTAGRPGGGPALSFLDGDSGDSTTDDADSGAEWEDHCLVCDVPLSSDADSRFHPYCSAECHADAGDEFVDSDDDQSTIAPVQCQEIPQADLDRMSALKREISEIDLLTEPVHSASLKARSGCWVLIGADGNLDVRAGYARDREVTAGQDASTGVPASARHGQTGEKRFYSAALARDLAAHRTQAFQVALAGCPSHALTYLLYTLWAKLDPSCCASSASTISGHPALVSHSITPMNNTAAALALAAIRKRLSAQLAQGEMQSDLDLYLAIHRLSEQDRGELLAYLVALTVAVDLREHGSGHDEVVEYIGGVTGADPAQWWRPTAADFFGRVSKDYIMSNIQVLGRGATLLAGKKKAQMMPLLDKWFASPEDIRQADFGPAANSNTPLPPEVVSSIKCWLPVGMSFTCDDVVENVTTDQRSTAA